ncbi:hypothetical protein [Rhizobium binxianense]
MTTHSIDFGLIAAEVEAERSDSIVGELLAEPDDLRHGQCVPVLKSLVSQAGVASPSRII